MNLVGYTATALSRNDIEDTPTNKNVVDFAIVELKDLQGNLVVMYDDAEGANPETQKTCDTNGQVTFFAEIGDYVLEINGKAHRINLSSGLASSIETSDGRSVQEIFDDLPGKATTSQAQSGVDDANYMTPLKTKQAFTASTGTAAARDVGEGAGNVMEVGAFGLGSGEGAVVVSDFDTILSTSAGATIFIRSAYKPDNPPIIGYNYFAGVFRSIYSGFYVYEVRAAAPKDSSFTWRRYYSSGTWGNWVREYGSENIVGTVTQSGGVPTGAIIESGSNSNGSYTKYADGTMICDNNNNAITTNPAAFVGSVTSIDGNKLRIGKWF